MENILDTYDDPAWVVDPTSQTILSVNQAAVWTYGYSREEFLAMTFGSLRGPKAASNDDSAGSAASDAGANAVCLHFKKDGSSVLMNLTTSSGDLDGRAFNIVVAKNLLDLLAGEPDWEESLKELKLLRTAINHQNDVLIITKAEPFNAPEGPEIVYVNDAFEQRTGYSRREAIGATPRILQGEETDRAALDEIRRALERWRPVRVELLNYTKAGEKFWIELDIVPVANASGWFTHWVSFQRDVTERREAQLEIERANEELSRSRKRFRELAELSADWFWETDMEQRYTFVSRDEALERLGMFPEKMLGRTREELFADYGGETVVDEIGQHMERQEPFYELIASLNLTDGKESLVSLSGRPFYDGEGRPQGYRGTGRDVTQAKRMEQQLFRSQKLEAVGKLTGGIAHDFNNVLNVIIGNAEIILEDPGAEEEVRGLAEETLAAAERASELTSRLLAFSRQQPLEAKVSDLNKVLENIKPLLRRSLPENINLEEVLSSELWPSEIDPAQFESAILNLVLNARDAMPEGGTLVIETHNETQDSNFAGMEDALAPGDYAVVSVSDSGHGMTPQTLASAFDPFFTTKPFGEGSGLGLSMVFGFLKQSGGHVGIYSEEGQGTTIRLYFAKSEKEGAPPRNPVVEDQIQSGSERILAVEDDHQVRKQVIDRLRRLGYEVTAAASADEAIALIERGLEFDLLFTDIVLPGGMSGRQLADWLLERQIRSKILFTSGYSENAIVRSGKLEEGITLLSKPYRQAELAAKVREVLDA